ncbi:MAG: hypothetical protein E7313_06455 [Clostridiales bacterium]|nr:hypothetical protein [Clostridiales bacterium]
MKILKDKKIISLIVVLVMFTAFYFIVVNKISYAFSDNYDEEEAYKKTIEIIEKSASKYGNDNLELFEEEQIIYVKVQDLIDNNYLVANDSGQIKNPLNVKQNLNSNIIKLKYDKEKIYVEVDA